MKAFGFPWKSFSVSAWNLCVHAQQRENELCINDLVCTVAAGDDRAWSKERPITLGRLGHCEYTERR